MIEKYKVITLTSGHEIYNDKDFEITKEYLEFAADYNRMIHREIILDNVEGVYSLCKWIYFCDRAFPFFTPMLEVALKRASAKMFVLVFWMWSTWFEERDEDDQMTYSQACEFAKGSVDELQKIDLLTAVKCINGEFLIEALDDSSVYGDVELNQKEKGFLRIVVLQEKQKLTNKASNALFRVMLHRYCIDISEMQMNFQIKSKLLMLGNNYFALTK